ncbi:MAG: endo-1,4-beta-xylanase [Ignavibacteriaceae bacterium]
MKRREFIKKTALAGAGAVVAANELLSAPLILTSKRTITNTEKGELIFKPYFIQDGAGPHLGMVKSFENIGSAEWDFPSWAFASDTEWDAFYSNIFATKEGVKISDTEGRDKFGINVRWNVEGFGYIYMTADNAGEFYQLPKSGRFETLNLNLELAKSRAAKNRERIREFVKEGWSPSRDLKPYIDLSEEYLADAVKSQTDTEKCAKLSQQSLYYSMWAGEKIEIEKAWFDIKRNEYRKDFFIGCDTDHYTDINNPDLFIELFSELFNYATITHYLPHIQKEEGVYTYGDRDDRFRRLKEKGITVEGRPVFWADDCCTPNWLLKKSFPDVLKYVEKHAREVVGHYGDGMYAWEIINEAHDFSNAQKLVPDQMVEIAKLIADTVKDVNPKVHRLINNCCINADYVQIINWKEYAKKFPLITPHQFIKMCHEAGVDFTITGQQLYYQYTNRDIADTIRMTERLKKFGRPVQITEIGTTSGPTKETVASGDYQIPKRPYSWHREWDPDLQAEWMEQIYTVMYSKQWIEAINWYDFSDPFGFIPNGGLLANPQGEKKPIFERLKKLKKKWEETY